MNDEVTIEQKTFQLFLSAEEIDGFISTLASKINEDYQDKKEIILISILDGSFIFMADLVRKLNFHHQIKFVKLRSYKDLESTGEVEFILDLDEELDDKDVLIVEDIIDTGLTIEAFLDRIKDMKPKSLKVCTLFSKPEVHNDIIKLDYIGQEIPPHFIVGYGLDLNGKGRHLPAIYKLKI